MIALGADQETVSKVVRDTTFRLFAPNAASYAVFTASATQWRTGPNGIVGLDYPAVVLIMRALGIKKSRRNRCLLAVRDYEAGALGWLNNRTKSSRSSL